MLPIPKELQNQKAIPFMEWYEKKLQDKNAGAVVICDYNYTGKDYVPSDDLIVLDFYNQPFTHESLRLFEGWGENTCYDVIHGGSKVASNEYKLMYCDEFVMAFETLNDFITLCNLEGINLKWKGETE